MTAICASARQPPDCDEPRSWSVGTCSPATAWWTSCWRSAGARPPMSDAAVLDASAVLALLQREPGQQHVAPLVGRAAWSTVNLSEVASKLADRGMPPAMVREALESLHLTVHDLDEDLGFATAELCRVVPRGMSVG